MISRETKLREMGLGPVWRLRTARAEGQAIEPQAVNTEPQAVNTGPQAAAGANRNVARGVPATNAPRTAPALSAGAGGAATPAIADDLQGREQDILRMDWPELQAAVSGCVACGLCKTRRQAVFGVGDERAEWMLVGEAPGAEEDARGEPFVGQAGRLLDNMLGAMGMARGKNVYIANVLKCRPPGNRNPEPGEVTRCSPHLVRQLTLIQPKLILALGRFAAQCLLGTEASISSMRGKVHRYQGVPVIVTYHPAYLLGNLPDKAKAWQDLCFAQKTMDELRAG